MTVKLVLLKSGEDIIADVQEMVIEQKPVGYFFENPCIAKVFSFESSEESKSSVKLNLTPWIPLSSDKKIPVPLDWVITIVEPISQLKEMYEKTLSSRQIKNGKETN